MIATVVFWIALVYLIAAVAWRLWPSRRARLAQGGAKPTPTVWDYLLGRGWIMPAVAAVVMVVALGFAYLPQLTGDNWTEAERAEIDHFIEAVSLYGDASMISQKAAKTQGDWESVNAMLQASMSEADQVSDEVLGLIDPELPAMFRENFYAGLRIGTFGLRQYVLIPTKRRDTLLHTWTDSLQQSRVLLEQWNEWFTAHKPDMMDKLD